MSPQSTVVVILFCFHFSRCLSSDTPDVINPNEIQYLDPQQQEHLQQQQQNQHQQLKQINMNFQNADENQIEQKRLASEKNQKVAEAFQKFCKEMDTSYPMESQMSAFFSNQAEQHPFGSCSPSAFTRRLRSIKMTCIMLEQCVPRPVEPTHQSFVPNNNSKFKPIPSMAEKDTMKMTAPLNRVWPRMFRPIFIPSQMSHAQTMAHPFMPTLSFTPNGWFQPNMAVKTAPHASSFPVQNVQGDNSMSSAARSNDVTTTAKSMTVTEVDSSD